MKPVNARYLGKLPDGTRVTRFQVCYRQTDTMSRSFDYVEGTVTVSARNAGEACNYVMDEGDWSCPVEVWTYGVKGGKTVRFSGWESVAGRAIMGAVKSDSRKQLGFEI